MAGCRGVLGLRQRDQLGAARHYKADLSLSGDGDHDGPAIRQRIDPCRAGQLRGALALSGMAPAWILALWGAFSLTFTQSLAYLQTRLAAGGIAGSGRRSRWHTWALRAAGIAVNTSPVPHGLCPAVRSRIGLGAGDTGLGVVRDAPVGRAPPASISLLGRRHEPVDSTGLSVGARQRRS